METCRMCGARLVDDEELRHHNEHQDRTEDGEQSRFKKLVSSGTGAKR